MVKIKKPTPSVSDQPDNCAALTPSAPVKDGASAGAASFEQDRSEASPTRAASIPDSPPVAELHPPRAGARGSGSGEVSGVSGLPEEFKRAVIQPVVPDSSLMEEKWSGYLSGPVSEEELRILEPQYEELSALYDGVREKQQELRLRALQLEQAALVPRAVGSNAVLLGREAYEIDVALHGERVAECERDTQDFALQLVPTVATMHPKRNRIKNMIIEKLNVFPDLARPDTTFVSVHSRFIGTYGGKAGEESHLDGAMNALELLVDCQNYRRRSLESRRVDYAARLTKTLDVDALKRVLAGVESMEQEYDTYARADTELTTAATELMDNVALAAKQKDEVIAQQRKVSARKRRVRPKLEPLKLLIPPRKKFMQTYREVQALLGPQEVDRNGLHQAWELLQDFYADRLLTFQYLRRVAEAVDQGIDAADSMKALDRVEERIQALQDNVQVFTESSAHFDAEVARFNQTVTTAREEYQRKGLAKRGVEAMARFSKNPAYEAPEDLLSEITGSALKQRDPVAWTTLMPDYDHLRKELRALCGSVLTIKGLETTIIRTFHRDPSESGVMQMEEDVLRHHSLVASHNARLVGYKHQSEDFLKAVAAFKPAAPAQSPRAVRLLETARHQRSPLFNLVSLGASSADSKGQFEVVVADRVAALKQLLVENPSLDIHARSRSGDTLVHRIVKNRDLGEHEKIEVIRCLVDHGARLNEYDQDNYYPLDRIMRAQQRAPDLVAFLQRSGAVLSPRKHLPVLAHFIGMGGIVSTWGVEGLIDVDLEGMTPRMAEFYMDPHIKHILAEQVVGAGPSMKAAMGAVHKAYHDVRSDQRFIDTLRLARAAKTGKRLGPVMLSTGWDDPSGHAVGFVFNQEIDGSYLYACNTGSVKDPTQSVVKYQVENFDKAIGFFRTCAQDGDRTRLFYTEDPADYGFQRCETTRQLPLWINKSSQKRGNCPMASRKACILAMLWSTTRAEGVSPEKVRATYKAITTEFRVLGVNQLLAHRLPEIQGGALVSMITKFDRPACQKLAHRLADEILRVRSTKRAGRPQPTSGSNTDPTDPTDPIARLKSALEATNQDIGAIRIKHGESLAACARRKGNKKTYELLCKLTA